MIQIQPFTLPLNSTPCTYDNLADDVNKFIESKEQETGKKVEIISFTFRYAHLCLLMYKYVD